MCLVSCLQISFQQTTIRNRSDQRRICEVGLRQAGEDLWREAFRIELVLAGVQILFWALFSRCFVLFLLPTHDYGCRPANPWLWMQTCQHMIMDADLPTLRFECTVVCSTHLKLSTVRQTVVRSVKTNQGWYSKRTVFDKREIAQRLWVKASLLIFNLHPELSCLCYK